MDTRRRKSSEAEMASALAHLAVVSTERLHEVQDYVAQSRRRGREASNGPDQDADLASASDDYSLRASCQVSKRRRVGGQDASALSLYLQRAMRQVALLSDDLATLLPLVNGEHRFGTKHRTELEHIKEETLRLQMTLEAIMGRELFESPRVLAGCSSAERCLHTLRAIHVTLKTIHSQAAQPTSFDTFAFHMRPVLDKLWTDGREAAATELQTKMFFWKHKAIDLKTSLQALLAEQERQVQNPTAPTPSTRLSNVLRRACDYVSSIYLCQVLTDPSGGDTKDNAITDTLQALHEKFCEIEAGRVKTIAFVAPAVPPKPADPTPVVDAVVERTTNEQGARPESSHLPADHEHGNDENHQSNGHSVFTMMELSDTSDASDVDEPLPTVRKSPPKTPAPDALGRGRERASKTACKELIRQTNETDTEEDVASAKDKKATVTTRVVKARTRGQQQQDLKPGMTAAVNAPARSVRKKVIGKIPVPKVADASPKASPAVPDRAPTKVVPVTGDTKANRVAAVTSIAATFATLKNKEKERKNSGRGNKTPPVSNLVTSAPSKDPSLDVVLADVIAHMEKAKAKRDAVHTSASTKHRRIPSPGAGCALCHKNDVHDSLLLCDNDCGREFHTFCLTPPLDDVPTGVWWCPNCAMESASTDKCLTTFCNRIAVDKYCPKHKCKEPGCNNQRKAEGYCRRHEYNRVRPKKPRGLGWGRSKEMVDSANSTPTSDSGSGGVSKTIATSSSTQPTSRSEAKRV
ncbi:TPA: hypothetical protein N0F65_002551 [Lagenidium giganteum]|uniref:PHD-type domain-containing protein n=1 Tax=Lagenidium giganteum TaxID=4803 RepID=A0AAV2YJJ9_9STRA|nr:TPA: hypothetical protein N0F65_002551 [Lagenidium giganteum]